MHQPPNRAFRILLLAISVALIAAACGGDGEASQEDTLSVIDGDTVEVHYVLTLDDGEIADSSRERGRPLEFTVGGGRVIAGFDDAVRGTSVGDVVDATIAPAEAYGEYDASLTAEVEITESQSDVQVGDSVFLTNGQEVVILEINDRTAVVDLNHPLAGETLYFEIEVLSITRG